MNWNRIRMVLFIAQFSVYFFSTSLARVYIRFNEYIFIFEFRFGASQRWWRTDILFSMLTCWRQANYNNHCTVSMNLLCFRPRNNGTTQRTSFQLNEKYEGTKKKVEFTPLWRLNYFYYVFGHSKKWKKWRQRNFVSTLFQTNSLHMHSSRDVWNEMKQNLWR